MISKISQNPVGKSQEIADLQFNTDSECLGLLVIWVGNFFHFLCCLWMNKTSCICFSPVFLMNWWLFLKQLKSRNSPPPTRRVKVVSLCSDHGECMLPFVSHLKKLFSITSMKIWEIVASFSRQGSTESKYRGGVVLQILLLLHFPKFGGGLELQGGRICKWGRLRICKLSFLLS